jgi:pyridoxine/pyridoxamine 5'-phosphate oxidase
MEGGISKNNDWILKDALPFLVYDTETDGIVSRKKAQEAQEETIPFCVFCASLRQTTPLGLHKQGQEERMSHQDVIAFVKENPACFIATMDGDQPRVRGFLTVLFDDGKFYFTTGTMKSVYRQLSANPNIELCYCSQDFRTMLRIAGKIEFVDDREQKP